MSDIITDIRIIKPEDWMKEIDGKWYVHIPFECPNDMDTIMEFVDDDDYIQEHKEDFDALNNGTTENNICTISADIKPSCLMQIKIKTLEEAGGEVLYDKYGNAKYIPPERSGFDLASMLGGLSNMGVDLANGPDFSGIIDNSGKVIASQTKDDDNGN